MRTIPETANRQDWPRLVASALNETQRAVSDMSKILKLTPGGAPASPQEGWIYADSTTHKLRYYDGTTWNDLF